MTWAMRSRSNRVPDGRFVPSAVATRRSSRPRKWTSLSLRTSASAVAAVPVIGDPLSWSLPRAAQDEGCAQALKARGESVEAPLKAHFGTRRWGLRSGNRCILQELGEGAIPVEFGILGPLEVLRDGQAVEVGATKQRALLAVLLIHANRVVSIDRLVDDLWGAEAPARATNTVQVYISALRRVLEPERPAAVASGGA